MTKRVLVIALGIMSTLLGLVALWQFRVVLVYVLLSLVIAATFRPISRSESRRAFGFALFWCCNILWLSSLWDCCSLLSADS